MVVNLAATLMLLYSPMPLSFIKRFYIVALSLLGFLYQTFLVAVKPNCHLPVSIKVFLWSLLTLPIASVLCIIRFV